MEPNLLILGGTTEATALARAVAGAGIAGTFSYAGRVANPRDQPLPLRVGGFGGPEGLADWIREHGVTHVVDATHPFASQMSHNAVTACRACRVPLIALTRLPWQAQVADHWWHVPDTDGAVDALGEEPRRVFLAIGRMHLAEFVRAPRHFYLLRLVDPPEGDLPLPDCAVEVSRGPFSIDDDIALMRAHRIDVVVSKNSGGDGARAKIDAARRLHLPVIMIDRPGLPQRREVHTVDAVMRWLDHAGTDLGV